MAHDTDFRTVTDEDIQEAADDLVEGTGVDRETAYRAARNLVEFGKLLEAIDDNTDEGEDDARAAVRKLARVKLEG